MRLRQQTPIKRMGLSDENSKAMRVADSAIASLVRESFVSGILDKWHLLGGAVDLRSASRRENPICNLEPGMLL
jgi:hypothetical protein